MIYARLERIPSLLPYPKHFLAIDPLFETTIKLLSNEIRETICEGLKWMCKLFEINAEQDF